MQGLLSFCYYFLHLLPETRQKVQKNNGIRPHALPMLNNSNTFWRRGCGKNIYPTKREILLSKTLRFVIQNF